ncbi:alpha/beta fold hydrolase [Dietzia maris]|uniref:alpha/beta fold hydrolase n=1 Tax=Dietzia maris TaxID=37915 RepID=UPI00223B7F50|nr:alpha/beta hydrolase [Dietzia maris]MCT1432451.1 alpha/beta hydrolase [Dietzia maris]MCT1519612.1 alpha/beta hydrolase [Dietzia maris]
MSSETATSRLKWQLAAVAGGAIATSLIVDKLRDTIVHRQTVGHWDCLQSKREYSTFYGLVLDALPEKPVVHEIATEFGTVRALEWRVEGGGTPVLLLPGMRSGAVMWQENLEEWIGQRSFLAVDPLGDAGFSAQTVPLLRFEQQGEWIAQVVSTLGLDKVHVVGHSFGGASACAYAMASPEQLASLTVIEPVMVIDRLPVGAFLWATMAQMPLPAGWQAIALARLGGTTVEETRRGSALADLIATASKHFSPALPVPGTLTDDEWRQLPMPVRADIAGTSSLAGGQKAVDRLRRLRPEADVTLWPDATHSLPMQEKEAIGAQLLEYWRRIDGSGAIPAGSVERVTGIEPA